MNKKEYTLKTTTISMFTEDGIVKTTEIKVCKGDQIISKKVIKNIKPLPTTPTYCEIY